ncbi:MAG: hypothetical protein KDC44_03115 [Phaeodactylibacter sp.]|nr:hypothetical protein [Phaeodactylibacter sp.]
MKWIFCYVPLQVFVFATLIGHPSWGIKVDRSGQIYFADILHHGRGAVWKLSPTGQLKLLAGDFHAHNVDLDADGQVISAHGEDTHLLVRFREDGEREVLLRAEYPAFNGGNAAWTQDGRTLFHAEHYIWEMDGQGRKRKFHPQYLEWTQTLYMDQEGILYVPEKLDDQGRVLALCPDGSTVVWGEQLIAQLDRPFDKYQDVLLGITKDGAGNLYVCESAGQRILRMEGPGGQPTVFYHPTDGWTPCGIDFFQGDAYILEYDLRKALKGPRIVRISERGKRELLYDFEANAHQFVPQDRSSGRLWWAIVLPFLLVVGRQWVYNRRKDSEE